MIRITKAGWLYILLTIFLGFSAVNTGNNLIFLIVSALLGFMSISGFFGRGNLSAVEIRLDFPKEIYARKPFPCKVTLINRRRFLPGFLLRVTIENKTLLFPYIETGAESVRYLPFLFSTRGNQTIGEITISSVFPFNFFVRSRRLKDNQASLVFPEPIKCEVSLPQQRNAKSSGEQTLRKAGFDMELLSIREYVGGDPLKFISWKATAKTGALKTKLFSTHIHDPVIIDFESIAGGDIEEKVSCAAYLFIKLLSGKIPAGLRMSGRVYKPGTSDSHKHEVLKALALYGNPAEQ